jgi:hypothetical protein
LLQRVSVQSAKASGQRLDGLAVFAEQTDEARAGAVEGGGRLLTLNNVGDGEIQA